MLLSVTSFPFPPPPPPKPLGKLSKPVGNSSNPRPESVLLPPVLNPSLKPLFDPLGPELNPLLSPVSLGWVSVVSKSPGRDPRKYLNHAF